MNYAHYEHLAVDDRVNDPVALERRMPAIKAKLDSFGDNLVHKWKSLNQAQLGMQTPHPFFRYTGTIACNFIVNRFAIGFCGGA
jgi:hypothetical protein